MNRRYSNKPNILWICTDQQRYDSINCLGNDIIKTPNINRIARDGVTFTKAYSQSPVCSPSRACFLTGRYPRTTGVTQNGNEFFPEDEVLITKILSDNGYDCGLVGKLHLSSCEGKREKRPNDDGYRFFKFSHHPENDFPPGDNDYQTWLEEKNVQWGKAYKGMNRRPKDVYFEGGIEPRYHQTTWCAEESINFIKNAQNPWLLSVNIFDPHPPFDAPMEYKERYNIDNIKFPNWKDGELNNKPPFQLYDYKNGSQGGIGPCFSSLSSNDKKRMIADYYAAVELIDDQLGRIIETLEITGQKENTVIIFHSDHGEMLGDHGLYWKGAYFYEELVHIPLIVSWPKYFAKGIKSKALVELVDLAPSILEIAGIKIPYYMQGESIYSILTGEKSSDFHKKSVYCEYYNALRIKEHDVYATMYLDGRFKIVVFHGEEYGELYDLKTDPSEYNNLWHDPEYKNLKSQLIKNNFDKSAMILDPRPKRIGRF